MPCARPSGFCTGIRPTIAWLEDRACHAVRAVGELVQQLHHGIAAGRLVAVDVGRDPQDRRRTTDDRGGLPVGRRGIAQAVEVAADRRQPVQVARGADERVTQGSAAPRVRVHPCHHPVAGSIDDPPVAADLRVARLARADPETQHTTGRRDGAAEVRLRADRIASLMGAERPAGRARRGRHAGETQNDAGGCQSGKGSAHARSVGRHHRSPPRRAPADTSLMTRRPHPVSQQPWTSAHPSRRTPRRARP